MTLCKCHISIIGQNLIFVKYYQEVKNELIKDIAQLDLTITDLQDKVAHLNKVSEGLLNLSDADPENRQLVRYDYAKMNLTAVITLEKVEQEVKQCQEELRKLIDDYEHRVRRLEKFVSQIAGKENLFPNQQKK
ncbi:hypothetical protein HF992_07735 [Streptococcus ovuberis]|uniref:Group II intron-interrupted relaxase LtrB C-terminal domain-containing protein n=1 Tax=Streptococcus ovuberis TaxID=1936207 RepID=A0A7X6MZM0_9STRE|nr:hypothetical protein [Streptococcus ovuberis]